jgi:hypothetical protein
LRYFLKDPKNELFSELIAQMFNTETKYMIDQESAEDFAKHLTSKSFVTMKQCMRDAQLFVPTDFSVQV